MSETCNLRINNEDHELDLVVGTENEVGIDISKLRSTTGCITLDDSYGNTGSCQSKVTFIDGEKGILRYRGYSIEELANKSTYAEVAYLLIFGDLPTKVQLSRWSRLIVDNQLINESMKQQIEGFPITAHPMAVLSSMINATSTHYPEIMDLKDRKVFEVAAARLIAQIATIAAFSHKYTRGEAYVYPDPKLNYSDNFLHMMFSLPNRDYNFSDDISSALRFLLILHADHEQNCSTSTVRMVGSSQANLYASTSAGVCALWGPLHGGANQKVLEMLDQIIESGQSVSEIVEKVKKREFLLMGFGHRVYKNFDPRAQILKGACEKVLAAIGVKDPMLRLAQDLEKVALEDDFFIERKLYPNVDFYSGIIYKAIGIPVDMFTVLFAMGRMPGWIAHWREIAENPKGRICRPRQIYQGPVNREYVSLDQR